MRGRALNHRPPERLWRWPLPAVVGWVGGWALLLGVSSLGVPPGGALLVALLPPAVLAARAPAGWRRWVVLLGLPALLVAQGGLSAVPPWGWLAAAALLLALYPLQAWRDAPLYPTASDALTALPNCVRLPAGAKVLDAGSGLGHGLVALRRAYPHAQLLGVERSGVLQWASRLRRLRRPGRPGALGGDWRVQGGDFWALSWAPFDLVYLFQRPETMPKAWAKACAEMRPGTWLVSLEFAVAAHPPQAQLTTPGGRALFAYRIPEPGISVGGSGGR